MWRRKTIPLLLTASLVVSAGSQSPAGDFCDIAEPIRLDRDVASVVVTGDRAPPKR